MSREREAPLPKILLVAPCRPLQTAEYVKSVVKALVAPADLATVAALTPAGFEVDIWDEAVRGKIESAAGLAEKYAVIGVGGYSADHERAIALGRLFDGLQVPVVVGGVGVSSEPERYRDVFDVLFIGEAEYTWPRFLADLRAGAFQPEYRQVSRVDMHDSPAPRWDSIASDVRSYGQMVVQTTRGCPFDCEFCDVISLFGRQPRHKKSAQVLEELRRLNELGATSVALADDNMYGDPRYTKPLLREIAALNASFERPMKFWTQITLNVSKDDEMLRLLSEANVQALLIGIETPNHESLVETNKPQNYKLDIVSAIRKIQGYGFRIEASLIVGFDHDDETIFEQQYRFIQEACLVPVSIWTLTAIPGTKLWVRLRAEGRVFEKTRSEGMATMMVHQHNVLPKAMSLEALMTGYRELLLRVNDWDSFERRLEGLLDRIHSVPPLMLRMARMTEREIADFFQRNLAEPKARESLLGLMNDADVSRIKARFCERHAGDSDREKYIRELVETVVDEQYLKIHHQVPLMVQEIEQALERLATSGLPPPEGAAFSLPDAFRRPYRSIFQDLHAYVLARLADPSRVEDVLAEIVHDFLARWGESFVGFEPHHEVQLVEICDRAISAQNGPESPGAGASPPAIDFSRNDGRIADLALRRLSADVLRSVELAFRRVAYRPADGSPGAGRRALVRLRVPERKVP